LLSLELDAVKKKRKRIESRSDIFKYEVREPRLKFEGYPKKGAYSPLRRTIASTLYDFLLTKHKISQSSAVLVIAAAILAARRLAQYEGGKRVPAIVSAIADAIQ
jgi:hypothetical protein